MSCVAGETRPLRSTPQVQLMIVLNGGAGSEGTRFSRGSNHSRLQIVSFEIEYNKMTILGQSA